MSTVGRRGLPCEVILRCGILKHLWQSDYRELEFALVDSASARRFTRVDPLRPPKRSALQRCIRAVRAETWERINRVLLGKARDEEIETGRTVRIDSTVTETNILDPSDSQLLYDAVRVLSRLLARGREKLGPDAFPFHDHRRAAKRRKWKIPKARMKRKVKLYRELLAVVRRTLRYADAVLAAVEGREEPWLRQWRTDVAHYRELAGAVVSQTVRRVLKGETVPAEEKVVSLFEPHTDIIRKGGRRVQYGHKVNLGSGACGLVFDAVVEAGNPPDSTRCLPMIERHSEIFGSAPEQVACDGGLCQQGQSGWREGTGRARRRLSQESGPQSHGHGLVSTHLRAAEKLSGGNGGRGLVPQALLRPRPLQLARAGALPGLRLVGRRHAQPVGDRALQVETGVNPATRPPPAVQAGEVAGTAVPAACKSLLRPAKPAENPLHLPDYNPKPPLSRRNTESLAHDRPQ